ALPVLALRPGLVVGVERRAARLRPAQRGVVVVGRVDEAVAGVAVGRGGAGGPVDDPDALGGPPQRDAADPDDQALEGRGPVGPSRPSAAAKASGLPPVRVLRSRPAPATSRRTWA